MPVRRPSPSHLLGCAPSPKSLGRIRQRAILVLIFAGALIRPAAAENWNWRATALLKQARSGACAVRMADDRVLVTGGTAEAALASSEIYQLQPEERFADAAPMNAARSSHGCALLKVGRILVVGGGAAGIELYEPSLDTWTPFDSTILRAEGTTVMPLTDGRVLILGGKASEVEVFDPDTSTISILPVSLTPWERHSVTLLRDGRLLIAGGMGDWGALNTADILNPDTGEVTALTLSLPRADHSATALFDGRVLLAGGTDGASDLNTLDVWSPEANTFQLLGATLSVARRNHTALSSEANGFVLITSGSAASQPLGSSELFDPSSDSIQPAGSLTVARTGLAGVVLADGSILALGGRDDNGPSRACGVLPNPSFRPSQSTYHPLERALVSGSTGVTALNGRISFDLAQIDAGGKSIAANARLISAFGTLVNGSLPSTPVVDLGRADIGSTFVLTMRAAVSSTQVISGQVRFNVKLRPTLAITGLTGAIVAGQPVTTRTTLSADGANVNFSGTLNLTAGGVTLAKSISATAASFATESTLCCPLAGKDTGASGMASLHLRRESLPGACLRLGLAGGRPFSIGYTVTVSNQGVTIPGGTSLGGAIELRENGVLIQQLPAPSIPSGVAGTIGDGSSNTILPSSLLVNGTFSNLILPLGQHTITLRFLGSGSFQASETQVTVRVQ